jgi:hypothetical protein
MNRTIDRVKLVFLLIFAILCVIAWSYQALYVWPRNKCEKMGDWWDWRDRVCAVPMPIWRITGRAPGPETPALISPTPAKTPPKPPAPAGR